MIALSLQTSLYGRETLEAVLYKFAGKFSAQVNQEGEFWIIEIFQSPDGPSLDECTQMFRTELVDQSLRAQIALKTEHIKTLILSNAFSRTSLVPQDECANAS